MNLLYGVKYLQENPMLFDFIAYVYPLLFIFGSHASSGTSFQVSRVVLANHLTTHIMYAETCSVCISVVTTTNQKVFHFGRRL